MQLTDKERLNLINQYSILKKLEPENVEMYEEAIDCLVTGYELEFDFLPYVSSLSLFSEEKCRETRDILDMFRFIKNAQEKTTNEALASSSGLQFSGFDGNDETLYMAYAEYLYKQNRWTELFPNERFNSHCPVLPRYQRMLAEWQNLSNKYELTDSDLKKLQEAAQSF